MTSLDFKGAYFHIPVPTRSRKFLRFHFQNQWKPISGPSLWPINSSYGVDLGGQRGQELGWIVNLRKSELEPKQVFDFVGRTGETEPEPLDWGSRLGDFTASGTWSVPESQLHINFVELNSVLLALKRFQHMVQGKFVLVATDNTTVVAYINEEGGMRSGSLSALLWWLLCWCNLRHVVLKARHIPGHLNVIADKLFRQGQLIRNGLFIRRYSTSCVKPDTVPRSTCLRPGTIAN